MSKISIPNHVLKILVDSPDPAISLDDLLLLTNDSGARAELWAYALTNLKGTS